MSHPSPFISVTEINPNDQILDCRFQLSTDGANDDAGFQQYLEGHIPYAQYIHLNRQLSGPVETDLRGRHPGGRHPLPKIADWAETLATLGLTKTNRVVVYDQAVPMFAARAWWMLSQSGFNVAVLDGGLNAWLEAGKPIETGQVAAPSATAPEPLNFEWNSLYASDLQSLSAPLVDARAPERFNGSTEPLDPVAGHIEGAINRPFMDNFSNGKLREETDLRTDWGSLASRDDVVHYCGSGVTACVNVLVATHLGASHRLYNGSWSDWCSQLS